MPGCRMIEKWIGADLERILGQPEELFIHALTPEVGVPNPSWDDDGDKNRGGDGNPRLPSLGGYFPVRRQGWDFRQHRQWGGFDQVLFAADAIIHEFGADAKQEGQRQTRAQTCE